MSDRHSWSDKHRPDEHRSLRVCWRCFLTEVTRHEPGEFPWKEFNRDGVRVRGEGDHVPKCEAVQGSIAA